MDIKKLLVKGSLKLKKYAPEISIAAGIVGGVTSCVLACKATLKADEILDEHAENMEKINRAYELQVEEYTEQDKNKDTFVAYRDLVFKFAKAYGPSLIIGAASIFAILKGCGIYRGRHAVLVSDLAALRTAFTEYRGRVSDKFGEETEKKIYYNIKEEEIETTETTANGKEKTKKEKVEVIDPDAVLKSPYAKFFDESCAGWTKDPEANKDFLLLQQEFATRKLHADGYLFLNDVYAMLGIPKTKKGQTDGWIDNASHTRDVDFGIFSGRTRARDFVNGYENVILLDFDVDGCILDNM